jgi:Co/Zn/Cd efflux system component
MDNVLSINSFYPFQAIVECAAHSHNHSHNHSDQNSHISASTAVSTSSTDLSADKKTEKKVKKASMNMYGIFLHVLADALGSSVV